MAENSDLPPQDDQDAATSMRTKLQLAPMVNEPQTKPVFMKSKLLEISSEELLNPDLSYEQVAEPNVRGVCLLFNHHEFDRKTGQSKRDGTNVDADVIERVFTKLRYKVIRLLNAKKEQYISTLEQVRLMDHSNFDSFVCFILSHGSNGVIYTYDDFLQVDEIVSRFRGDICPNLVGKPKLFFIQACRGESFDKGAVKYAADDAGDKITYKLPVEADILVSNSTVPGYFAWRNSQQGSWYIQELCKILSRGANRDIVTLLAVVARNVAVLYESNTGMPGSHAMKQMTSLSSTLTKLCFLTGHSSAH